jgi:hypothetical protein
VIAGAAADLVTTLNKRRGRVQAAE